MCYVMSQLHSIQVFSWYFPSASGHPDKVHKEYKAVHYQNFGSLHFMFHVWISGKGHLQKGKIENSTLGSPHDRLNQLEKLEAAKAAWPVCLSLLSLVLLGPSGLIFSYLYRALLSLNGHYLVLLSLTGPYLALLGLTGPYLALLGLI